MRNKYVNLKSDWGFKHLMGNEPQMRSFINSLLCEDYGVIQSITFENVEVLSEIPDGRGVIFDLLCRTESGDKIVVEMQNYSQLFFKTRANYYLYTVMAQFFNRGDQWSKMKEDIPHIIGIFILGQNPDGETETIIETEEFDRKKKIPHWDRMRKYYIILENFDFSKIEQPSLKDCWIEIIKNLGSNMYKISPSVYEKADPALLELIERANVCNLTKEERIRYEAGLKAIEDSVDFYELLTEKMEEADQRAEEAEAKAEKTIAEAKKAVAEAVEKAKIAVAEATIEAKSEGLAEGRAEGLAKGRAEGLAEGKAEGLAEGKAEGKAEGIKLTQLENAKKMLAEDFTIEMIAKITGLTQKEIENLQ